MAYWLTDFDGLSLPANLGDRGSQDIGVGTADAPLISLPGGRVFDPLGVNLAFRSSGLITVTALLVDTNSTNLKADFDAWQAKIGKVGTLTRTPDNAAVAHTITARLLSASSRRITQGTLILPITLSFQVIGFPWAGNGWTGNPSSFTPGTASISTHVYTATMTNNGNVNQTAVAWSFHSNGGSASAVTVTNTTTGHSFTYSGGTIASGKSLIIDNAARTVKNDGANDYVHFTPPSTFEDWFLLAPGSNTVTYAVTFAGTNVTVAASFFDAWG